ncbi:protein PTST homolog 2, chloroplastic-like [Wolffia australiana]
MQNLRRMRKDCLPCSHPTRRIPLHFASPAALPSLVSLSPRKRCRPLVLYHGRKGNLLGWICRGAGGGAEIERALALEAEIFDFMEKSSKPNRFPTKEELIAAKRMDLVEAIADHGGWLAFGWDLDGDDGVSALERGNLVEKQGGIEGILSTLQKERRFSKPEIEHRSSSGFDAGAADRQWNVDLEDTQLSDHSPIGSPIISDIKQLESELVSVLSSLGSRTNKPEKPKSHLQRVSVNELDKLSDELEFKETEIANVRDKLRSARAKLATLEGMMALKSAQAAKMVGEKQRRVEVAKKALCALATACIVWAGAASEVFLVGSYDGWASKRRMENSGSGIFTLQLRLYPGQYEIKFIVDGVWRVDPLRPIAFHSGFENNILIIQ